MNIQAFLALGIGLLLGAGVMYVGNQTLQPKPETKVTQPTISETPQANMHGDHAVSMDQMSMSDMTQELVDKTGDDFDRVFIQAMISHHQGAIDMAEMAKTQAKHSEIKQMSEEIISAQTREIEMMQTWQKEWGY